MSLYNKYLACKNFPLISTRSEDTKIQRYKDTNEVLKWPVCDDMVESESEIGKAPDLSAYIFGRRRSWWCAWFLPENEKK